VINIFHGDNQELSRLAFTNSSSQLSDFDILKVDSKTADENQIFQFLNSQSLLSASKAICFSNFFSIAKPKLEKIIDTIKSIPNLNILIWQDKTLTQTQLKTFPQAKINYFQAYNNLYLCLNQIKPHNIKKFIHYYKIVINTDFYDLFFYLLKNNLRKKVAYSSFNSDLIKKTYLNLIELEFQLKTGTLAIPKEIALERIMIKLLT